MAVPYVFANATSAIPLSNLDNNFSTPVTIGNVAIQLGNTVSAIGNVTLNSATLNNSTAANVTISSVSTPITAAQGGTGNSSAFTANAVVYASTTSTLATGSGLVFDGSNLGLGVTPNAWNSDYKAFNYGNQGLLYGRSGNEVAFGTNWYRNTSGTFLYTATNFASYYAQASGVHYWFTAPSGTAGTTATFAEAMRIDSGGNLLIGTTSASGNGERINATGSSTSFIAAFLNSSTGTRRGFYCSYTGSSPPNDNGNEFLYCNDNSALRMAVLSNGGIKNYAANNVVLSDRREKTNFAPATAYLDKICAIPVQTFNYIDQNLEADPDLTLGVVAQDMQSIAPELVTEGNWGTEENPKIRLEIYQTDLQYALMKCIQELNTLITAQSTTIQSLTDRITALEAK